jgi:hypothetical protein
MDQQNQIITITFTRDELQILKEALWNYQLETDKSSRKIAFRYLKGIVEELTSKSKMSKALAEKIKDL